MHGDVDFGKGERQAIEQAVANLARDTNGKLQIDLVWDLDFKDMVSLDRAHRGSDWVLIRKDGDPTQDPAIGQLVGITSAEARVVALFYDRLTTEREWVHTSMHELLHAAGASHVCTIEMVGFPGCGTYDDDDVAMTSILFPMYDTNAPTCMSRADAAEFCRAAKCSVSELNYCGSRAAGP